MPIEGHIAARLSNNGLEVAFKWTGDRFTHGVSSLKEATLDYLEGPVFQEVHQQGDLVFASGMSGDRHWSMSVEPCAGGLLFDVACRCKTPMAAFGSAYKAPDKAASTVIGKAIDGADPPTLKTLDGVLTIRAFPDTEPPATYRYRYAIVQRAEHWINEERGNSP